MRPCVCGKPVRLGAQRITFNRRRGVMHYVVHADNSPLRDCVVDDREWTTIMFKPYPRLDTDKPWAKMVVRWNGKP